MVLVTLVLKGKKQLALHPFGPYRAGRKQQEEPVAAAQGGADLIVPLLHAGDVALNKLDALKVSLDPPNVQEGFGEVVRRVRALEA